MISASISAAAAMRKLGFWTNFGIMARDAPPRPIMPTPKTRSLAIDFLLSRDGRAYQALVFDDYPSTEELSRSAGGLSARATVIPLLRAGLLIYIRPWFNAFKTFKSFKPIPDSSQR